MLLRRNIDLLPIVLRRILETVRVRQRSVESLPLLPAYHRHFWLWFDFGFPAFRQWSRFVG